MNASRASVTSTVIETDALQSQTAFYDVNLFFFLNEYHSFVIGKSE